MSHSHPVHISTVLHVHLKAHSTYRHNGYVDSQLIPRSLSSVPASSRLSLPFSFQHQQPSQPSPTPSPTLRADHRVPTANVTHASCISLFTTGAHHKGLSGQFSVLLCQLLNTLWGSYPLQLTNTVLQLPSCTATISAHLSACSAQ